MRLFIIICLIGVIAVIAGGLCGGYIYQQKKQAEYEYNNKFPDDFFRLEVGGVDRV